MQQNQLVLFQPKYEDAERVCVVKGYKDGLFTVVALGPAFVDLGITVVHIAYPVVCWRMICILPCG